MAEAKEVYVSLMEDVCGGAKPYLNTTTMEAEHRRIKDKAIHQFQSKRKMGGEEFSEKYKEQLEKVISCFIHFKSMQLKEFLKDLEDTFTQFKSHNESKNIFKAARTPAVFFALAVICYIASGITGLIGAYTIANAFNIAMGISLLTLATWAYIR